MMQKGFILIRNVGLHACDEMKVISLQAVNNVILETH